MGCDCSNVKQYCLTCSLAPLFEPDVGNESDTSAPPPDTCPLPLPFGSSAKERDTNQSKIVLPVSNTPVGAYMYIILGHTYAPLALPRPGVVPLDPGTCLGGFTPPALALGDCSLLGGPLLGPPYFGASVF